MRGGVGINMASSQNREGVVVIHVATYVHGNQAHVREDVTKRRVRLSERRVRRARCGSQRGM